MTCYIIILCILFVVTQIYRPCNNGKKNKLVSPTNNYLMDVAVCGIVFIILWFIEGFRYEIGTDYSTYVNAFEWQKEGYDAYWLDFELGYVILSDLIAFFFNSNRFLFIITAFITLYFVVKTYRENSVDWMFSLFLYCTLYFYFHSFNTVRNSIAMVIFISSFSDIRDRKLLNYLFKILLAALFHRTIIIVAPFYFIATKRFKTSTYSIIVVLWLLVWLLYDKILQVALYFFPKYSLYTEYKGGSSWVYIIVMAFNLLLLMLVSRKKNLIPDNFERQFNIFLNAALLAIGLFGFSSMNVLLSRFAMFFALFSTLSLPFCVEYSNIKERRLLKIIICILMFGCCIYFLTNNVGGVVPYQYKLG